MSDDPPQKQPLLSICVPTYNRAHLLRVMLQSALPQFKEHCDLVELCVSDNASSDNTSEIVESSRELGPLRYSRNEENLGFHGNLKKLTTELARGKYIWLLGDDDLLRPGAVKRMLSILENHSELNIFHLNYYITKYPAQWPADAVGGYDGPVERLFYERQEGDRCVAEWREFVEPEAELHGAMFTHIIHNQLWRRYWEKRTRLPEPHAATITTIFPHSEMLSEEAMNEPSYFIADPLHVTYYGSQLYLDSPNDRAATIWLILYPRLLRLFYKQGLSRDQYIRCRQGVLRQMELMMPGFLKNTRVAPYARIFSFVRSTWRFPSAWKMLLQEIARARRPFPLSTMLGLLARVNRVVKVVNIWAPPKAPQGGK